MIRNFKDKDTRALYEGKRVRRFLAIAKQAERRLQILESATTLQDLQQLPSNHFKGLSGNRKGQYSIRINNQWRVCFRWKDDDAYDVEIIDYH